MESNELAKQTKKLLLARRTLFRNTGFDALHNRYLHSHFLLNLRTGCCIDVCPGCFRSLSDADLTYKVRLAKPELSKNDPSAVIETFRCRFCNGQMRTRTRLSKRLPETKSQPNLATSVNPFDVVSPATPIAAAKGGGLRNPTGCSSGSGKKARRQQKLCKELKLRPSGGKESRNSFEDFLNLLS